MVESDVVQGANQRSSEGVASEDRAAVELVSWDVTVI